MGGERIFLAGQNIYPCGSEKGFTLIDTHHLIVFRFHNDSYALVWENRKFVNYTSYRIKHKNDATQSDKIWNCKMSFKNEGTHSTFFDIFNNKKYEWEKRIFKN